MSNGHSGDSRDPYFMEGVPPADLVDDLAGSHDRPITDEQVERAYDAFVIEMVNTGSTKKAIRLALEAAR